MIAAVRMLFDRAAIGEMLHVHRFASISSECRLYAQAIDLKVSQLRKKRGFEKRRLGLKSYDVRSKGFADVHRFKPVLSKCRVYAQAIGLQHSMLRAGSGFEKRPLGLKPNLGHPKPQTQATRAEKVKA